MLDHFPIHPDIIIVTFDNPAAKRLYETTGYHTIGDKVVRWSHTPPGGQPQQVEEHVWVLRKTLEPS